MSRLVFGLRSNTLINVGVARKHLVGGEKNRFGKRIISAEQRGADSHILFSRYTAGVDRCQIVDLPTFFPKLNSNK